MFDPATFCTAETMGPIVNFNQMHSMKVAKNEDGKVSFWYKQWSRHRIWKPYKKDETGMQQTSN